MTLLAQNEPMLFDFESRRNINDFSDQERSLLMRDIFERQQDVFQHVFGANVEQKEFRCETHSRILQNALRQHLTEKALIQGDETLEELHEILSDEMRAYTFADGLNGISKQCYDMPDYFQTSYLSFVKEFLHAEVFKRPFWFQQVPTVRIHCPNAENSHHYPRYHTDIGYGHPPGEINIWVPLTDVCSPQQHGFRLSDMETTREYLGAFDYDFKPFIDKAINDKAFNTALNTFSPQVTTPFGSLIMFDSRVLHTGEPLQKHTRISMDIRIMLCDDFEQDDVLYQGSGRQKVIFAPGYCYDSRSSDQL